MRSFPTRGVGKGVASLGLTRPPINVVPTPLSFFQFWRNYFNHHIWYTEQQKYLCIVCYVKMLDKQHMDTL